MLWTTAGNTKEADVARTSEAKNKIVQATQWEVEIAKMKTRLSDDSGKLAASAGRPEEKSARRQVSEDKENLAAFEKLLEATGPVAKQQEALAETDGDRWTVRGEYGGSVALGLMGIGLLVSSFLRERVDAGDAVDTEG